MQAWKGECSLEAVIHDSWSHENAANCDGFSTNIADNIVVEASEFEDIGV